MLLFTSTKRMQGRLTASRIASVSAASFLPRLGSAFTSLGGTSRTWWPSAINSRPKMVRSRARLDTDYSPSERGEERPQIDRSRRKAGVVSMATSLATTRSRSDIQ